MSNDRSTDIFEHLTTLADPTRDRLLLLLESHELTVGELCAVLQLPQSTVSRHLKALADAGWVTSRAEGTSRLYAMDRSRQDPAARRLWLLVREQVGTTPSATQDHHRLQGVLAERRSKSQEFFSSAGARWDRLRDELFGANFHLHALLGLLDDTWSVADLGAGTGAVSAALALFVERVIAIDNSVAMLNLARKRLRAHANVELRRGDLESLPLDDGSMDAATLMLVLPYLPAPERVIREAARVLKPGGRLLIADLLPHDREGYRQQMGHVWLGFSERQIGTMLHDSGFTPARVRALPPDPKAKGPALFVAVAKRAHADAARQRAPGGDAGWTVTPAGA